MRAAIKQLLHNSKISESKEKYLNRLTSTKNLNNTRITFRWQKKYSDLTLLPWTKLSKQILSDRNRHMVVTKISRHWKNMAENFNFFEANFRKKLVLKQEVIEANHTLDVLRNEKNLEHNKNKRW